MTNHPNRQRTYWLRSGRGFANEYVVGIATTLEHADQYEAERFDRISRDQAMRYLSARGDDATRIYACVTVDGSDSTRSGPWCRFEVARAIRAGTFYS